MSEKKKSRFEVINSPFALLIAGFLLTTLVGSYINKQFHEESWKSKARFEIFKERLEEAGKAQDSIMVLSNKRITTLWRIYFELESDRLEPARDIWRDYRPIVQEWNNNVKSNKNRLHLLFGETVSEKFLDDQENQAESPKSLHHIIRVAHGAVLAVIECRKRDECGAAEAETLMAAALARLDRVGRAHDDFSTDLRIIIQQKEAELTSY